jgi:hypothetical protein
MHEDRGGEDGCRGQDKEEKARVKYKIKSNRKNQGKWDNYVEDM